MTMRSSEGQQTFDDQTLIEGMLRNDGTQLYTDNSPAKDDFNPSPPQNRQTIEPSKPTSLFDDMKNIEEDQFSLKTPEQTAKDIARELCKEF
jgi:hypothetical protein